MSKISKKSLYFKENFLKKRILKSEDLVAMRPAIGISPMEKKKIVGRKLKKNVKKNHLVNLKFLK